MRCNLCGAKRKRAGDVFKRSAAVIVAVIAVAGRVLLAGIFWLASVLAHSVHVEGLEHDEGAPSTYFALAHKRDQDPFIVLPPLIVHRGWRALTGEVRFALRGDAFAAGFLARIAPRPRWFARLIRPLNLSGILNGLGIYPIQGLQQPAEAWIRAYLRDAPDMQAGDVLESWFLADVATSAHRSMRDVAGQPLSYLLAWRYQPYLQRFRGLDIFLPRPRRAAKQLVLTSAKAYLAHLAEWLSHGGSLVGAPEGELSPDGKFTAHFTTLHRLLRTAPPETRVVPIHITYDFMTTGRPRVFIAVAPAIPSFASLTLEQRDAALLDAWRCCARITCSQLCAGFLVEAAQNSRAQNGGQHGSVTFTLDQILAAVRAHAASLAADGRRVDPALLGARSSRRLAARFLTFCERRRLIERKGKGLWTYTIGDMVITVGPGEVGFDQLPLAYAWNELRDLLASASIASGTHQRLETHT